MQTASRPTSNFQTSTVKPAAGSHTKPLYMSHTSSSPLWALKLSRHRTTSRLSQLDQWSRARNKGQSPSQEAQTAGGADAFVLHNSTEKMARKPLTHTANASATKDATQRKEMIILNDGTSEGDEDDESDWSDWNAKANKSVKRSPTPDSDLAQSTSETSSSAKGEEEEDDSDVEEQLSRADVLGYTRSPVCSPTQVEDEDVKDEKGNEALRSPAFKSASGDRHIFVSDDKSDSLEGSSSEASAGEVKSAEYLHEEPVRRPRAQKTRQTATEQSIVPDGASEQDSPASRNAILHDENMAPAHTTASDQEASSPSSIFDIVQDSALLDSDLVQNSTLKRKRRSTAGRVSGPGGQPNRKRRKRSIFSPPTSLPPEDEEVPRAPSPGLKAIQGRFKIHRPVIQPRPISEQVGQDQGSVAAWVKPLSLDSSLKHPLFNPSPLKKPLQRCAADLAGQNGEPSFLSTIAAPRRPAKRSGRKIDDIAPTVEDSRNDEGSTVHKKSRKVFPSPKGKSKTKPGVEYSSPPDAKTRTTKLNLNKKGRRKKTPKLPKASANDNVLDDGVERQILNSSEPDSSVNLSEAETEESAGSPAPEELACKTCSRKFRHEKQLQTHKKNNRPHTKSYECSKCREEFDDKASLLCHQSRENHPRETFHIGRTGPFSDIEKQKLEQFVMDYCDDHGISETVFRQMMTDSSRRSPGVVWPWPGVTRLAFLNEYFAVLPDRAHKSMQRYKERYLQNLDHNKEWTKKDDTLLVDLVNELGPKWIEIGLRLNRTQDSVTSRYKKKLKDGDVPKSGPWSSHENQALAKAIEEIKNELGLAATTDTDEKVPWSEVSKRMGVIRKAQQCSAHWRWIQRCKNKTNCPSAKAGRKVKSKEFVSSDSDDEDPGPVKDDGRRERFASVVIPKNPTKKPCRATPDYSSESDSHDLANDPNFEHAEDRSNAAVRARISPELGSLDYGEQNGILSTTIDSPSGVFADPAERDDAPGEPVAATADEWERILEAEEKSLSPLVAIDLEDGVPDNQDIQVSQEAEVGENSPLMSTARMKGLIVNSKASRNPFNRKSPGRVMALSQIFNETQAPTSVLRQPSPNSLEIAASSSSRPSPGIRLKLRPDLSQDLRTPQLEGVRRKLDLKAGEHKIAHGVEMEELGDTGTESDEDAEMEDVNMVEHGSERSSGTSSTASVPEEFGTECPEQEQQVPNRLTPSGLAIIEEGGMLVDGDIEASEEGDTSVGSDESEDGYESSEEASYSGYESAAAGGSDEDIGNDDENDSMVKDTRNDFMANIKESAKYMSQWTPVAARKFTEESDDDSDSRDTQP